MCTIITIFEHILSDNHGAVDVLLRSTTITVDTHFLDSFLPSRVAVFSFLFSPFLAFSSHLLSLSYSVCVCLTEQEHEATWKQNILYTHTEDKLQKQYCFCMQKAFHIERIWTFEAAFLFGTNICHRSSCVFLFMVYFLIMCVCVCLFFLFFSKFFQISCLLALIFGINWFVDGACGMHDNNNKITTTNETRTWKNSPSEKN